MQGKQLKDSHYEVRKSLAASPADLKRAESHHIKMSQKAYRRVDSGVFILDHGSAKDKDDYVDK